MPNAADESAIGARAAEVADQVTDAEQEPAHWHSFAGGDVERSNGRRLLPGEHPREFRLRGSAVWAPRSTANMFSFGATSTGGTEFGPQRKAV